MAMVLNGSRSCIHFPDGILRHQTEVKKVKDMRGNPLLLFKNEWGIQFVLDRNEGLEIVEFSKE